MTIDDFFTPNLFNQAHEVHDLLGHGQNSLSKNNAKGNAQFDGKHAKNKAGNGGEFWEYRPIDNHPIGNKIDWRKSAKSDSFFSKSIEEKNPQHIQFWLDLRTNMHWSSEKNIKSKAELGAILTLGLIWHFRSLNERVSIINQNKNANKHNLVSNLWASGQEGPENLLKGTAIFISDGLEPAEVWRKRFSKAHDKNCTVLLCVIIDPQEREFNYHGRIEFATNQNTTKLLINDCEAIKTEYLKRHAGHFEQLEKLCNDYEMQMITIDNAQSAGLSAQKIWDGYCQLSQNQLPNIKNVIKNVVVRQ